MIHHIDTILLESISLGVRSMSDLTFLHQKPTNIIHCHYMSMFGWNRRKKSFIVPQKEKQLSGTSHALGAYKLDLIKVAKAKLAFIVVVQLVNGEA